MGVKRVLIFCMSYYPRFVGGAEIVVKEITDRLDKSGEYSFDMITLRYDSSLKKEDVFGKIKIFRIGFSKKNVEISDLKKIPLHYNKYLYQFLAPVKAISLHKKKPYDIVWGITAHSGGVPASLFSFFFKKVKYVQSLHEGDPPQHIEKLAKPFWFLFKRSFTKPDVIQAVSFFLAEWARKNKATCPIYVVPNGIDIERFKKRKSTKNIFLEKKIINSEKEVVLITVSRLVHKNAVDIIIKSLKFLSKNIKLVVIGVGSEEMKLRELVKKENLERRVYFLGEIKNEDIPIYLQHANIFIRPSRSEGFGISFIEAMISKLPVIGTREGGIKDFLFSGLEKKQKQTGWIVEKDSPNDIAKSVNKILSDKKKTKEVVNNAFSLVKEKYDWKKIILDLKKKVFNS
jgi:glycosyltransferase involved in cell wall biosynthesis